MPAYCLLFWSYVRALHIAIDGKPHVPAYMYYYYKDFTTFFVYVWIVLVPLNANVACVQTNMSYMKPEQSDSKSRHANYCCLDLASWCTHNAAGHLYAHTKKMKGYGYVCRYTLVVGTRHLIKMIMPIIAQHALPHTHTQSIISHHQARPGTCQVKQIRGSESIITEHSVEGPHFQSPTPLDARKHFLDTLFINTDKFSTPSLLDNWFVM